MANLVGQTSSYRVFQSYVVAESRSYRGHGPFALCGGQTVSVRTLEECQEAAKSLRCRGPVVDIRQAVVSSML